MQIFTITWLAYAGFYFTPKSLAVANVGTGEDAEVGLTSSQLAWIDGRYLVAYACGQRLWGKSGDRFGTRRIILAGMLGSILAGLAMGLWCTYYALGGFINGCGAIIGGTLLGFVKDSYGWGPVLYLLAGSLLMAGLLLLPKWNEMPATVGGEVSASSC